MSCCPRQFGDDWDGRMVEYSRGGPPAGGEKDERERLRAALELAGPDLAKWAPAPAFQFPELLGPRTGLASAARRLAAPSGLAPRRA
jgi:hypothetical protein